MFRDIGLAVDYRLFYCSTPRVKSQLRFIRLISINKTSFSLFTKVGVEEKQEISLKKKIYGVDAVMFATSERRQNEATTN